MEFVTGALSSLIPKLGELLKEKYNLQKDLSGKIESLSAELQRAQAVLRMVGEVPPEQHNELVKLWASDLREASYDMEDIIDAYVDDGPKPTDPGVVRRLGKQAKELFKKTKHRITIADAVQDMEKKLLEINARHGRYPVNDMVTPAPPMPIDPRILNIEKMAKNLVGIDEPMKELIKMLSLHERDNNLYMSNKETKIVYVIGMGGLGKTTLATSVYEKIKLDFPLSAFVSIGQNPDMKTILWNILNRLGQEKYMKCPNMEMLNVEELIEELKQFITGKRFFIVIDDIWDKLSWQILESVLQNNDCGSRVIVTTRKSKVATIVSDVYNMKPLSDDNSKELLYTITGSEGKYLDSSSTEACDKILKKCGGVPLAIITIASLLASRPGQDWSEVYCAIDFGEEDNDEVANTKRILSFSYYDLPSHLKNCLLYLSIFPEDYEINKNLLIWMWIAEGFVPKKQNTNIGLYELGESYFNELINRSMIQPIEVVGHIDGCRVHDMVLDLARSLTSEQNFVTVLDNNDRQRKPKRKDTRRLALHHTSITNHQFVNMDMEKVRSFVATECKVNNTVALPGFRVLRVLSLERCDGTADYLESSLQCVGRLCHLTYLRLSSCRPHFVKLPKELGDLKFLKILDLGDSMIKELPEELGRLTQLLCLRITHKLEMVPAGLIGKLTSLQELELNLIGDVAVMQFVKELGNLRELRVLHAILDYGLTTESMMRDFLRDFLQSLGSLHKVHTVRIYGSKGSDGTKPDAGSVSSPQLWQLLLPCIKFFTLPSWINSSALGCLSHLEVKVQVVKEQDMETLGRLPVLCYLILDSHTRLISIKKPADDDDLFQKLRFFSTPSSFVRFDLHGHESSTGASIIMPRLESLRFSVHVRFLKDEADLHAGLDNLLAGFNDFGRTSLKKVTATIRCKDALAAEVQGAEMALANAAYDHPNHPVLRTRRKSEKKMRSPGHDEPISWSDPKVFEISVYPSSNDQNRYHSYLSLLKTNPSLEKLIVNIHVSKDGKDEDAYEAVAAARNLVDHHINRPTLEINRREASIPGGF